MDNRCRPLNSLQEAYLYLTSNPPHWSYSTKPLTKRTDPVKNSDLYYDGIICHCPGEFSPLPVRYKYGDLPKTLLCHDMKNGYQDDSPLEGTINFDAYTFYHWAGIDIFVYFSHHFITIPPLGWINTAHQHGVQILGTVITEWEKGLDICNEFLRDDEEIRKFAHCLVVIAKVFKLDGWLLNIENKLPHPQKMKSFVEELTQRMHREIPDSVVIWYDSVTIKGDLIWQNGLTRLNKDFFDVCDGIFTNYTWDTSDLEDSRQLAGSRKNDVYVGIDIWGRNFWGGGGFNTVEAVREVHKNGLSMAIFASAWTHEAIQLPMVSEQQINTNKLDNSQSCSTKTNQFIEEKKNFQGLSYMISSPTFHAKCSLKDHFHLRENSFWNSIWNYLNTRGPISLPFKTSFCLGCGKKKKQNGEVVDPSMWFNLTNQQHQISVPFCSNEFYFEEKIIPEPKPEVHNTLDRPVRETTESISIEDEASSTEARVKKEIRPKIKKPPKKEIKVHKEFKKSICLSIHTDDSLNGGSCIKLSPTDANNLTRLLVCEFLCDSNFVIYYAAKVVPEESQQDVSLYLTLKNNNTKSVFGVILSGEADNSLDGWPCKNNFELEPVNVKNVEKFKILQKNIFEYHANFYIPVENRHNWIVRYYCLEYSNCTILDISSKLKKSTGSILLGAIGVVNDIVSE